MAKIVRDGLLLAVSCVVSTGSLYGWTVEAGIVKDDQRSFAAYGRVKIPADGVYRFRATVGEAGDFVSRLAVNGAFLDENPVGVRMAAGEAAVAVYARAATHSVPGEVRKIVGPLEMAKDGGAFAAVEVADAPVAKGWPVAFEHEFRCEDGTSPDYAMRSFVFEAPESGLYEIAAKSRRWGPGMMRIWVDDLQVAHRQRRDIDAVNPYCGEVDHSGRRDAERVDFFGKDRLVRYLEKGKHKIDFYAHPGPWWWDDHMAEAMSNCVRFGISRLSAANPVSSTGFWLEGRDSMVFEFGKGLRLRAQSAAKDAGAYTCEVTAYGGEKVWSKTLDVTDRAQYFDWPCDREGAFEYVVRDAKGGVVEGPWSFAVVDPTPLKPAKAADIPARGRVVDAVDCTEEAGGAHDFRDNGTSRIVRNEKGAYRLTGAKGITDYPYVALRDPKNNQRILGWRRAKPGEKSERVGCGCDWYAYTLKVEHPGRPHIVRFTVPNDVRRYISLQAIDRVTGASNGWNIMAGDAPAAGDWSELGFFVWPNTDAIDVMVYCSNGSHNSPLNRQSAVREIRLEEYPEGLPPLPEAAQGWKSSLEYGWGGEQIDIGPNERTMPPLWADLSEMIAVGGEGRTKRRFPWNAFFQAWQRFGESSRHLGNNFFLYPVFSYCMESFQGPATRLITVGTDRYLDGTEFVDPVDRDVFMMMLMQGSKYGVKVAADFMIQRFHQGVAESWAKKWGCDPEGMVLTAQASGHPFLGYSLCGALGNPAHPAVRKQYVAFAEEFGRRYGRFPAFAGMRTRFSTGWPGAYEGWFLNATLGCDDWTVRQFMRETGIELPMANGDDKVFAERRELLYGKYGRQWVAWRNKVCLTLREEMLAALRRHAPQACLYIWNDEVREPETGLSDEVFAGRRELGWVTAEAAIGGPDVEWNFADPVEFANFNRRGGKYANPPLEKWGDAPFGVYPSGMCCNSAFRVSPYNLEPAAKQLAKGRLERLLAGGQWCLPPVDEGLRAFARTARAIPDLAYVRTPTEGGEDSPVAVWSAKDADGTLVWWAVNRTDSVRPVELAFDADCGGSSDLATGGALAGGRETAFSLEPFMVRAFRTARAASVASARLPVRADERSRVEAQARFLLGLADLAKGTDHLAVGGGKAYCGLGKTSPIGCLDVVETDETVFDPLRTALARGEAHTLRALVGKFEAEHRWWYEAFGWPADAKNPQRDLKGNALAQNPLKASDRFVEFVCVGDQGDLCELEVNGTFGGGFGPVRVIVDGEELGVITAPESVSRAETRLAAFPIRKRFDRTVVRLEAMGEKPLAVTAADLVALPPEPIAAWQGIGPFDRLAKTDVDPRKERWTPSWTGMTDVLEPETEVDLGKTYTGLDGLAVHWKRIVFEPGRKFLETKRHFAYDFSMGNGAAYALVWVKAPADLRVPLYYSHDFFLRAWINDDLAIGEACGPDNVWAKKPVALRRGWNKLLVKTACGNAGWYMTCGFPRGLGLEFSLDPH